MKVTMRHFVVSAALAGLALTIGASSAQAVNPIPNPGFEANCAGVPCNWHTNAGSTLVRDASVKHKGNASLRLTAEAVDTFASALSDCVALPPGILEASFWYLASQPTSANVTDVNISVSFYSSAGCANPVGGLTVASATPPNRDGSWHKVSGTVDPPPAAQFAFVNIGLGCSNCGSGATAWFDDVSLDSTLNLGFELACGEGFPCNWDPLGSAGLLRDGSTARSGAASLRLTANDDLTGAQSACVSITPGEYDFSFWYMTTTQAGSGAGRVEGVAVFYSDVACTNGLGAIPTAEAAPPIRDGQWHQLATTHTAPANAIAVKLILRIGCIARPCSNTTIWFDDVFFQERPAPTAAELASLTALRDRRGIRIGWTTASEAAVVGFHVWRDGRRLTNVLVAGSARGAGGATYSYLDRSAQRMKAHVYSLEVVRIDGSRRFIASVKARR